MVDVEGGSLSFDNKEYYSVIYKYLESEKSGQDGIYKLDPWIQAQASNYFLLNNTLFYDKRKPRKVVVEENQQNDILKDIHVQGETHIGVKKMHEQLKKHYFWRYCYKTISQFVHNCPSCNSQRKEEPSAPIKTALVLPPWTSIEFYRFPLTDLRIDEPLAHLAIMFDPISFWVSAAILSNTPSDIAAFIFENIANFGVFRSCTFKNLSQVEYEEIHSEFSKFTDDAAVAIDNIKFLKSNEVSFDEYLKSSVELYMKNHPDDWWNRSTLLKWLYKMRRTTINGKSPVDIMNSVRRSKFNPHSKVQETPTSPSTSKYSNQTDGVLSLNIPEPVATPMTHEGDPRLFVRRTRQKLTAQENPASEKNNAALTASTVKAVKQILAHNKEKRNNTERRKRGEYHRYTPEVRESIAEYAIQNGVRNASKSFTLSLGFSVSCSTVRNFMRSYHTFSSQLKEEIGRYAMECGVEAAKKHYSGKLGKPISAAFIRKFRRLYLRMGRGNQPVVGTTGTKQGKTLRNLYCTSVREEIGKYASVHGVQAAIRHFSEKLQCKVKESTVRKYRKLYALTGEASTNTMQQQRPISNSTQPGVQSSPQSSFNSEIPEVSYYVQNYSQYAVSQYGCQTASSYTSCTAQPYNVNQPVPPYVSYSALPPPPQYQPSSAQLPAYPRHWNAVSGTQENALEVNAAPIPMLSNSASANCLVPRSLDLAKDREITSNSLLKSKREFKKPISRGRYTSYSPQTRLNIGRFAAENGTNEAVSYFKQTLGHEIPESTIRTLRDKYVHHQKNSESDLVAVDACQRGRPCRLGAYDATVQECLKQLKRSGEPVNVIVTIATARQVLLDREPSLLEENGGPLKLTKYWAKSFLRRTGINKQVSAHDISPEGHVE